MKDPVIRYKLTTQNMITHGDCKWTIGEWKEATGTGELCMDGWLHCYSHPLIAVLHNPIHANIIDPRCWKVEVDGKCKDENGLKEGWTRMRLLEEIDTPTITTTQHVAYGIYCSLEVYKAPVFVKWANKWLSGEDHTASSLAVAAAARAAAAEKPIDFISLAKKAMEIN